MNVFLMRHGEAEAQMTDAPDDTRGLTPDGARILSSMMSGVRKSIGHVDFILTSPFKRALETSDILADHFKCRDFVSVNPALAKPGGEELVCKELNKLLGKDNIVVVGHVPYLVDLAAHLTGDDSLTGKEISKGGMAKIYVAGFPGKGQGRFEWMKTAEDFLKA